MATSSGIVALLFFSAVVSAAEQNRILTISNRCSEMIRVGRTGGRGKMADHTTPSSNTACPPGQTLNPNDGYCYWDLPSPNGGPWETQDLEPGQSIKLTLSNPAQGGIKWSGNIWGATGCKRPPHTCETAICFDGGQPAFNGRCPNYNGPVGPVTRAEFTLQSDATDFYDVTMIDGVNVPVEMKPSAEHQVMSSSGIDGVNVPKSSTKRVMSSSGIAAGEYWCGSPGGITAAKNSSLSGCSWSFNPTSILNSDQSIPLTLVAKSNSTNSNCTKDSDCSHGEVCGTLQQLDDAGGPGPHLFPGKCGKFIGLWNANGLCVWSEGVSSTSTFPNTPPFNCKTSIGKGTFSELYGCSGPYSTSGYNCKSGDSSSVCGCAVWSQVGINAPATSPCQCNNPDWQKSSLPWVEWMKKACPTAYTYPYDDASSTFQCKSPGYTITFCPGGKPLDRDLGTV